MIYCNTIISYFNFENYLICHYDIFLEQYSVNSLQLECLKKIRFELLGLNSTKAFGFYVSILIGNQIKEYVQIFRLSVIPQDFFLFSCRYKRRTAEVYHCARPILFNSTLVRLE